MLIGELAKQTGLPVHTIRFYEKEGLIDECFFERGTNNYRYYTEEAVERVRMIQHGQAAGYTLAETRKLIDAWEAGELTSDAQIDYLQQKVEEISTKIEELERVRDYLTTKLQRLHTVS